MDWLEYARREIGEATAETTANTAERNLTAVLAVPNPPDAEKSRVSNDSNGSSLQVRGAHDMVLCKDCRNLGPDGICRAAAGVMPGVWLRYSPATDILRRCECFAPRTVH